MTTKLDRQMIQARPDFVLLKSVRDAIDDPAVTTFQEMMTATDMDEPTLLEYLWVHHQLTPPLRPDAPLQLLAALATVATKLPAVPKTGEATMFKGLYRTYDDLMTIAGPLLAEHGIVITVNDHEWKREHIERHKDNKTWTTTITTLSVDVTFHHVSGEKLMIGAHGQSIDLGAFALGIARTYAVKDVLSRTLMVAFEGDDEAEAQAPEPAPPAAATVTPPVSDIAIEVAKLAGGMNSTQKLALKAWLAANGLPHSFRELDDAGLHTAKRIIIKIQDTLEYPVDAPMGDPDIFYERTWELWESLTGDEQRGVGMAYGGTPSREHPPNATGIAQLRVHVENMIALREPEPEPVDEPKPASPTLGAIRKEQSAAERVHGEPPKPGLTAAGQALLDGAKPVDNDVDKTEADSDG